MTTVEILQTTSAGWQSEKETWDRVLQNTGTNTSQLIFASLRSFREMPPSIRDEVIEKLQIPLLLFDKVFSESNGFSGCDFKFSKDAKTPSYVYWSRFVVKQTFEELKPKPTFTRHFSTHGTSLSNLKYNVPVHSAQTVQYGWEWYEMIFFCYWNPSGSVSLMCFDVPARVQSSIQLVLNSHTVDQFSPYSIFSVVLNELIRLYDESVWSIRNHISNWEAARPQEADYSLLHEIARHGIHVDETLSVAVESISSLHKQHEKFLAVIQHSRGTNELRVWDPTENQLRFQLRSFKGLLRRSNANNSRIQNEITLAFNAAAQRDSKIQVQIGEEAKRETLAMKVIAVVTMTFLPATFVSSLFGMNFFDFERDRESGRSSFLVSPKLWLYWAIAIPLTVVTLGLWRLWSYYNKRFGTRYG